MKDKRRDSRPDKSKGLARYFDIGKNRSKLEVCLRICDAIAGRGPVMSTYIMHTVSLSHPMCKFYIKILLDRGIISTDGGWKKGSVFELTAHGKKWWKVQRLAMQIFEEKLQEQKGRSRNEL